MTARTVPGNRWACTGCGACCRAGYALGPVPQANLDALEAAGIRERWAPARDGWYDEMPGPDGAMAAYLRAPDGACVFLRDDQLCAIHAELGAELKPWFCRRYPLAPIEDARGPVVVVRPSCEGWHRTFQTGPELTQADLDESVAITPTSRSARFDAPAVEVLPGRGVSSDDWMELEDRMLAALAVDRDPWSQVRACRDVLRQAMPSGWAPPDPERAEAATVASLAGFHRLLQAALQGPSGSPPHRRRVVAVHAALERALQASRPGAASERSLTPEASAWLTVNLRSALLGKELLTSGPAVAGLGLFLVGVDLFARAHPGPEVPVEAFGVDWAMWHDLLAIKAMRASVKVLTPMLVDRAVRA